MAKSKTRSAVMRLREFARAHPTITDAHVVRDTDGEYALWVVTLHGARYGFCSRNKWNRFCKRIKKGKEK
jgi:hypothetical protein